MTDSDDFTPSLQNFITEVWDASDKLLQTGQFKVEVQLSTNGFLVSGGISLSGTVMWGIEFQFGYASERSILSAVNAYWPCMTGIEEHATYVQGSNMLRLPNDGWHKFREAVLIRSQPYISNAMKKQSRRENPTS